MSKAFGLDLAGYSTRGSSLVVGESSDQHPTVTVLDGHCFAVEADGDASLTGKAAMEIACLQSLLA